MGHLVGLPVVILNIFSKNQRLQRDRVIELLFPIYRLAVLTTKIKLLAPLVPRTEVGSIPMCILVVHNTNIFTYKVTYLPI